MYKPDNFDDGNGDTDCDDAGNLCDGNVDIDDTGAENHLKSSLTGGSGQEGWWTIGSGENHKSSSLFSW